MSKLIDIGVEKDNIESLTKASGILYRLVSPPTGTKAAKSVADEPSPELSG